VTGDSCLDLCQLLPPQLLDDFPQSVVLWRRFQGFQHVQLDNAVVPASQQCLQDFAILDDGARGRPVSRGGCVAFRLVADFFHGNPEAVPGALVTGFQRCRKR